MQVFSDYFFLVGESKRTMAPSTSMKFVVGAMVTGPGTYVLDQPARTSSMGRTASFFDSLPNDPGPCCFPRQFDICLSPKYVGTLTITEWTATHRVGSLSTPLLYELAQDIQLHQAVVGFVLPSVCASTTCGCDPNIKTGMPCAPEGIECGPMARPDAPPPGSGGGGCQPAALPKYCQCKGLSWTCAEAPTCSMSP